MKKIVIFLLALTTTLIGQQSFEKAYIVTDKGDTIVGEGKINPKKPLEVHEKIYFKDASGVQKNYRPAKLKGYGIQDKHFITLDFYGEPRFYQVLERGEINFYVLVFDADRINKVAYDYEYFIARPDNKKLVTVKQGKFKKQLAEWMEDNPEFLESYEDSKDFDAEKAAQVIAQYNSWKAGKTDQ